MELRRVSERPGSPMTIRPFHFLALDPGGTTGWAIGVYGGPTLPASQVPLEHFHFESGEIGPEKHHVELEELLADRLGRRTLPLFEIVCESFEYRQRSRTGLSLISKEYIGVVELFAQKYDIKVHYESASSAGVSQPGSIYRNDNLKALGWYLPGHQHANDATRHLVRHLTHTLRIRTPITDRWIRQ